MKKNVLKILELQKAEMSNYINSLANVFDGYDKVIGGFDANILFALNLGQLIKSDFEIKTGNEFEKDFVSFYEEFADVPNNIVPELGKHIEAYKQDKDVTVKYKNHYYLAKMSIDKINKYLERFLSEFRNPYTESEIYVNRVKTFKSDVKKTINKGKEYVNLSKSVRNYFKSNQVEKKDDIANKDNNNEMIK